MPNVSLKKMWIIIVKFFTAFFFFRLNFEEIFPDCLFFVLFVFEFTHMPNILITGTPGTGKTTLSEAVKEQTNLNHIDVGKLIKEKELHDGWDEKYQCYILNEDKVCDELEDVMATRNNIVDFHTCDFFPERWFDLVVVLRTDNTILYPRLEKRYFSKQYCLSSTLVDFQKIRSQSQLF